MARPPYTEFFLNFSLSRNAEVLCQENWHLYRRYNVTLRGTPVPDRAGAKCDRVKFNF